MHDRYLTPNNRARDLVTSLVHVTYQGVTLSSLSLIKSITRSMGFVRSVLVEFASSTPCLSTDTKFPHQPGLALSIWVIRQKN